MKIILNFKIENNLENKLAAFMAGTELVTNNSIEINNALLTIEQREKIKNDFFAKSTKNGIKFVAKENIKNIYDYINKEAIVSDNLEAQIIEDLKNVEMAENQIIAKPEYTIEIEDNKKVLYLPENQLFNFSNLKVEKIDENKYEIIV